MAWSIGHYGTLSYLESVSGICTVFIHLDIAHNSCNYFCWILNSGEEPKNV